MTNALPGPALQRLITPGELAWIFEVCERTVAKWTGGRKKKPALDTVRDGHVIRFTEAAVMEFIVRKTVRAERVAGDLQILAEADFEKLARRMERFIEAQIAARFERREKAA